MRMNYVELEDKPKTLQGLKGLNSKEFDNLLKSFQLVWEEILESSLEGCDDLFVKSVCIPDIMVISHQLRPLF